MSRSHGGAANPRRRVVDEEADLQGVTTFLNERDNGEELVIFNPDNFQNITKLFAWFSENVIAVVGPHGGAMINHRWANLDILVIEFMPANRIAMMKYEEASLLSQTYAAIIVEPIGLDMEIDPLRITLLPAHPPHRSTPAASSTITMLARLSAVRTSMYRLPLSRPAYEVLLTRGEGDVYLPEYTGYGSTRRTIPAIPALPALPRPAITRDGGRAGRGGVRPPMGVARIVCRDDSQGPSSDADDARRDQDI
ncbi:hypothetical protein DFH08DRAFT_1071816 [Mycena albidolilacea]|uniref:Uncharacterized protein n=1 Tax=Mycena albidolilacea TaxID=1033008 RepID=A0AAD7F4S2_9AGAR|nr:hypothetical protein DFH08DRAFT_1071816 [Mycena albidolilacea]